MQNQIIDSVIIRKAEEQDFEQILNIENQVAIDPWPKEIFISCAALYNAVVVTVEQVIVGYGVVAVYNSIDESHILNLAVAPSWQRIGIGSKLIYYLINLCGNKIFLEVHKNNLPAINLYKKFNFVEMYIRKNYYNTKNGKQDALVLSLEKLSIAQS
jgi:ribosomal-protein-alanine N-acetyltransferase